ncbi:MAG: hypothetical protein Q9164_003992 [Protoblastenia rupestris]
MLHPFQCLLYCSLSSEFRVLVAAAGPYIHTFDVNKGKYLSTWPSLGNSKFLVKEAEITESQSDDVMVSKVDSVESPRAAKRRKISPAGDISESSFAEIVVENHAVEVPRSLNPPIVKLAATQNGQHVIAVTGEDKCIRVFELARNGVMKEFSERYRPMSIFMRCNHSSITRCMPKRPSAIAITPDDSTILCADKFGDVYALPLKGQTYEVPTTDIPNEKTDGDPISKDNDQSLEHFVPSASSLTVHTKRNRDALRQQQKLIKKKAQKKPMTFEHQMILGHVSLLTDVACASLEIPASKPRNYIISADRDEHIRISRGMPQAHIIEGYCLGHAQFISKLCLLPSHPRLLISGGGDDYLLLWDWPTGQVKQCLGIRDHVSLFKKEQIRAAQSVSGVQSSNSGVTSSMDSFAVSNIHVLEFNSHPNSEDQAIIIVTIEGLPALFIFTFSTDARIRYLETQTIPANVIDMIVLPDRHSILCSLDTIHEPFSTTVIVKNLIESTNPCVVAKHFRLESKSFEPDVNLHKQLVPAIESCAKGHPYAEQKNVAKGRSLKELLYGLESLRKRASDDAHDVNE